jgi:hypothetical protein
LNSHLSLFSKTSSSSSSSNNNQNLSSNSINNNNNVIIDNNNPFSPTQQNNNKSSNDIIHYNSSKLQNSLSCQEFCAKHNLHHSNCNTTMNLGFHFHLAGFINAENGKDLFLIFISIH